MNLYINGSTRKHNCYNVLKDLMGVDEKLISLGEKNIKFCIGCTGCNEELQNYCSLQDDMKEIYPEIIQTDKIIIISPIYFNHITGILKNFIDRLNPFSVHEKLKNKKVYLITIGCLKEDENTNVTENIKEYFNELSKIFDFDFTYLKTFTSAIDDDVRKNYNNYEEIIKELREEIEKD